MSNIEYSNMRANASEASELLQAMANERRLMVMCNLLDKEMSVNQLVDLLNMNQSALSQHLARLRASKLVETRRSGQQVFYRLASKNAERVIKTLYDIYCAPDEDRT